MYRIAVVFIAFTLAGVRASAQEHQHGAEQAATHEHEGQHGDASMSEMAREGSGTAWQPDETPMYAVHAMKGPWALMFHENAFVQYLHESGRRGHDQFGSINWFMGMAQRTAGPGRVALRGMFSVEPWTIRGCGYPDLLASGEICVGETIHDQQHPHDLMMELAAEYNAPLAGNLRWQLYGGPAGEPALGPAGFPHRIAALPNPVAPISHHWIDSTHITFGVVTGGIYSRMWKVEASVFNGREPDENRTDVDFAPMDSFSGRLWIMPTPRLAIQLSAGHLTDAEAGDDGAARIDVNRITASATYEATPRENSLWATTLAWGRNAEPGHASNALLVETNFTLAQRDTVYGRFEVAGKSAHDLDLPDGTGSFTVSKLQAGYTRYLPAARGFQSGIGITASLGIVPEEVRAAYGSRTNSGVGVYLTVRPAVMMHGATP